MEDGNIHLFDEFVLDTSRGSLLGSGRPIHLRPQAYKALKFLAEHRGRLITKDQLIDEVWEGRSVTDDSLVQCLRDVRHALGDASGRYVRNERGRGYIFDPDTFQAPRTVSRHEEEIEFVRVVVEERADQLREALPKLSSPPATLAAVNANSTKRNFLLATAFVILAVAGIGSYRFIANPPTNSRPITSIAVLPLVNEDGNSDLAYLSDGVSESLINSLSRFPQLRIIARSSAFQYKNKNIDLKAISDELGVQAVLTGRVEQRGDDLLVSVELVDARDQRQIWGERYSRKAADLQSLERDITRAISENLRLKLTGAQEHQLTKRATNDSHAYELYLNGVFLFRKPGVDGVKHSLDYFNQAISLDPNFALAWLEIGRVNSYFAGNSVRDPKEAIAKAKAALQRAIELDETLAEAHFELARMQQAEWHWAEAENSFRRAIELNSNLAEAHKMYASYLSIVARHDEALAEIKRAQDLDPLRIGLRRDEAFFLLLAGRYDEAREKAERTMTLDSPQHGGTFFGLALIYDSSKMYPQAIDSYRKAMSILGETTSLQCYLGYALAMSGKTNEARSILQKLKTTKEYVSPTELATLYVGLGDREAAMSLLERAYREHDLQLGYLKVDSHFDSLRTDARFQNLIRQVGLPS
jgi:TolB-like protein/DNA-binding winged helix-turn-helix (wHTH) protein/Tfp pilus assembly protein PilF